MPVLDIPLMLLQKLILQQDCATAHFATIDHDFLVVAIKDKWIG
jgi:hypothetical protein